ncbi:MAG: hypothetical protein A2Z99_10245 [Treponema sp. GWB1_62_6]|nr:MAG: hypothetical protein A2Y36_05255 [Treponema sp. GWA1_62_8]OHE64430.1 MAG: hypothetical protein A2001_02085 [Treponema sp. GWC1_61_84]OHE67592.1 MAG: hypothetical protein A2Z99_10245 [Treponema sp. GWB1_62_6]OHE76325.1 MAG: hypothetical protein A2413_16240 [Treponema sp. RIFOXYC1_FULL_61_9]HCM26735.1 hypothetical protein [Treponema sp.]
MPFTVSEHVSVSIIGMEWKFEGFDADGFERVFIEGDFDLYSSPSFAASLRRRMEQGSIRFRMDCSGVRYLDSSGVGVIIFILQEMRKRGGETRFRGLSGTARKVLSLTNILPLLREEGDRP